MIAIDMEMPESCGQCEFEKNGECFILTVWMRRQELAAAYRQTMTVTAVRSGTVTLTDGERAYEMPEHEAWRIGDRAEAIVRDGKIVEVRFIK